MNPRLIILAAFLVIIAAPLAVRSALRTPQDPAAGKGPVARLVIITPHVQQIRDEFGAAFDRWHQRHHGQRVAVDWRAPGGTTEILKLLQSQYGAIIARELDAAGRPRAAKAEDLFKSTIDLGKAFPPGSTGYDLMIGGGTFDHKRLMAPRTRPFEKLAPSEAVRAVRVRFPAGHVRPDRTADLVEVAAELESQPEGSGLAAPMTVRLRRAAFIDAKGKPIPLGAPIPALAAFSASQLAEGVELTINLRAVDCYQGVSMSMPAGIGQDDVWRIFGDNRIGVETLYDPEQYWMGTALSGFGIVFNRHLLQDRNIPLPASFADLRAPAYLGLLAMADPRQSGSVATLYDSILNKRGWDEGWRLLREMSANARTFSSSSTQPPIDVGQGEALAGIAIDFYGRTQAQALLRDGESVETSRVGYVDPKGEVYIDADPVSLLRGGPNPVIARRFIEFCLTAEAQALWQFAPATGKARESLPPLPEGERLAPGDDAVRMGPERSRLRRMPIRREFYEPPLSAFLADKENPFANVSTTSPRGWRDGLGVMMGAFAIDNAHELRTAWKALLAARVDPEFDAATLAEMERLFYAMPEHRMKADAPENGGTTPATLLFSEANFKAISDDTDRWRSPTRAALARIHYTAFFRANYARVAELYRAGRR
jgi:ABC-type Fe3+ transport system substrate-binding protein